VTARVLWRGDCRVLLTGEDRALPSPLEREVNDLWTAACAQRPGLFNGRMLSAAAIAGNVLRVRATEYRRFFAQRERPSLRGELQVIPVGVCGLVATSDGRWLLGQRGASVTQYPLHVEAVPSGSLDERAFAGRPPTEGLQLEPMQCLMAELEEEAGIVKDAIAAVTPLGLLVDEEEATQDIAFLIETRHSGRELEARLSSQRSGAEYKWVRALPASEVELLLHQPRTVPTSRLLWALVNERNGVNDA
jgi:hypothetical protein